MVCLVLGHNGRPSGRPLCFWGSAPAEEITSLGGAVSPPRTFAPDADEPGPDTVLRTGAPRTHPIDRPGRIQTNFSHLSF